MSEDGVGDNEVGYGKPPKHSRFKKGNKANLKGRPKRTPPAMADIVNTVLDAPAEYRERGRTKKAPRRELTIKNYIKLALAGDVKAAESLLRLRAHALRVGDTGNHTIETTGWLPDHPGQTGEQKTHEFALRGQAPSPQWWKDLNTSSPDREQES